MSAIAVTGLTHRYGDLHVLNDVDISVATGELVALIGPTGCGKSTVLRVLAGLLRPSTGTATIDGVSTVGAPGAVGYMPQADTLLPWRRALANATLGAEVAGRDPATTSARARDLFARFGLAGFEDAWPSQLSGGMRQRVALLRTVLVGADVLVLDEPFGALDAITRMDLQGWLQGLLAEHGHTTLLVTHDVDEAARLADHIVVMSPRPGTVRDVITVPTPRPRSATDVTSPELTNVKRDLLALLAGR